jgi:hypothetical protein
MMQSRLSPSERLHDRYLEPSEKLDYEILVLASKGYLLLLRRLLLRAREHVNRAALDARIDNKPIDRAGEALILDIDAALSEEHLHVTHRD